ncbi:MAG: hypothetical protein ACI9MB_002530, partial [Verrucomicrobiales bacterium]
VSFPFLIAIPFALFMPLVFIVIGDGDWREGETTPGYKEGEQVSLGLHG